MKKYVFVCLIFSYSALFSKITYDTGTREINIQTNITAVFGELLR